MVLPTVTASDGLHGASHPSRAAHKANLNHVLESTESLRLKNAASRAELLDRGEVAGALENTFVAIRNIIEGSDLSDIEKADLFNNIASWPVILENVATQQQLVQA